jgi:hypothetical protein
LTAAKQRADEGASIAKALNVFTCEIIFGEARAATEDLARIAGEIVDGPTAKSKRAEYVASFRHFKRASDTMRSLAVKFSSLPPRPIGPEERAIGASFEATFSKAALDATQQIQRLLLLKQKYPNEIGEMLSEANQGESKKK